MKSHPVKAWYPGIDCSGKSRFALFQDISNVGYIDVPSAVSHSTVHDNVGHRPAVWAFLANSTNKYYQDIGVGCSHYDMFCRNICNVERNRLLVRRVSASSWWYTGYRPLHGRLGGVMGGLQ